MSLSPKKACPKQGKKPKKEPKWLKRGPFKPKRRWHAQDNPLKQYRVVPIETLRRWAAEKAREQLDAAWPAEEAFVDILRDMGIKAERQVAFYQPAKFILADFLVRVPKVIFEIDGPDTHDEVEDAKRDRWLLDAAGYRVVRFKNRTVYREVEHVKGAVRRALGFGTV